MFTSINLHLRKMGAMSRQNVTKADSHHDFFQTRRREKRWAALDVSGHEGPTIISEREMRASIPSKFKCLTEVLSKATKPKAAMIFSGLMIHIF
jgi:hypothetical protein